MTARQTHRAALAVAYVLRTGCTPMAATKRYGIAPSTVRRALVRAGVAPRPRGRPKAQESGLPDAPRERKLIAQHP